MRKSELERYVQKQASDNVNEQMNERASCVCVCVCAYVYQYEYLYTFYNHQPPSCWHLVFSREWRRGFWLICWCLQQQQRQQWCLWIDWFSNMSDVGGVFVCMCMCWLSLSRLLACSLLDFVGSVGRSFIRLCHTRRQVIRPNNRRFFDCVTFALCTNWIALSGCLCAGWHFI